MSIVSSRPTITRNELENVLDSLIKEELTGGNSVKTFESSLSELLQIKLSLAVNSLTSAYLLIFKALDIQHGDEII
ncbi:MAG TPA: DegT/DnrJ/EryC1/StrS family aminotransferase, partial [Spirochaetota bacterium]|nr:DegT/DnrJ/EryC1/StrS family aminotransferase [Spirochaetota bacterium]